MQDMPDQLYVARLLKHHKMIEYKVNTNQLKQMPQIVHKGHSVRAWYVWLLINVPVWTAVTL